MKYALAALASATLAFGAGIASDAAPLGPRPEPNPHIRQVQTTLAWSGSWIWTPENRKWVDKDNHASIDLLQGTTIKYCYNGMCWTPQYTQKDGIYSFSAGNVTPSYYEFWFGDFNSLEGRFWLKKPTGKQAPDAMIRMARR